MKTPFNRLATAAPRALDSLLGGTKSTSQDSHEKKQRERTCSFDLDLSGLKLDSSSSVGASSVGMSGSSIAEEGSVVTFQDLSELTHELSLDWTNVDDGMPSSEVPSPN
mmetsp:Transcript_15784/g.34165  ORF Transcript_15784/g.34165 Transcript_15784/m.34165 type:complete len:109 (+) Transcript_15784:611-937(+)|eukprot:CAMPEP_0172327750 /NCGR_PEP_ID=MMETSP1058-20130122/59994_1 /TAXON_ID=83371 /ORGANISM="Detonula confervacea, Strain CCMP 353" /LENGTH=108 /DNA_ID=CAMNT_0013044833 /DNA_START=631 /DNA_END=957 /DNA_ORIENTATION=-